MYKLYVIWVNGEIDSYTTKTAPDAKKLGKLFVKRFDKEVKKIEVRRAK